MPGPIYILTDDTEHFSVNYHDYGDPSRRTQLEAGWQTFTRRDPATNQTFKIWVRNTNPHMEVSAE